LGTERGALERAVDIPAVGGASVRGEDLERASLQRIALKGTPESTVTLSAGAGISSGLVSAVGIQPDIDVRLRVGVQWGPIDEVIGSLAARDARSLASGFRQTEFELRGGVAHRFFISRLSLSAGVELGALLVSQTDIPAQPSRWSLGPSAQLVLEARLPIVRPIELYLLGTGGGSLMRKITGIAPIPRGAVSGGVAFVF